MVRRRMGKKNREAERLPEEEIAEEGWLEAEFEKDTRAILLQPGPGQHFVPKLSSYLARRRRIK